MTLYVATKVDVGLVDGSRVDAWGRLTRKDGVASIWIRYRDRCVWRCVDGSAEDFGKFSDIDLEIEYDRRVAEVDIPWLIP